MFSYNRSKHSVFFGFGADSNNRPIISYGSSLNRTYLFATTLKLLQLNLDASNQELTIFHIDGTYKINREGYPMLVFGRSNPSRKIYPAIVGIVSKEETYAQAACSAAARQCFKDVIILMCWFHLKKAVKENIGDKKCQEFAKMIENDVNSMHYTANLQAFIQVKNDVLEKWSVISETNKEI
ncbi:unnamed protein product [Brachionus calyciflorus]|uniref:MULE transposase domain-containing protein n=1 Tax=Brachionus calyciflorus TaxID=104777 RepID=A0A814PGL3_9BILA|nr:unnamed protein product [Brachionus calyciflorus]